MAAIPSPNDAQTPGLLAALRAVTPALPDAADGDKLITHSRNLCQYVKAGETDATLTAYTVREFGTTAANAPTIVAAVRSSFCR